MSLNRMACKETENSSQLQLARNPAVELSEDASLKLASTVSWVMAQKRQCEIQ